MKIYALYGFVMGYIFGIILFPNYIYHGPDSNIIRKNIYYNSKNNKYYKFIPKLSVHPINIL